MLEMLQSTASNISTVANVVPFSTAPHTEPGVYQVATSGAENKANAVPKAAVPQMAT